MNGFLNILKPPGMSSGAVVAVVKRLTRERVGHAGTLDPEAAGVLPVMVGRATKLFDLLTDKRKQYIAEIAFGASTDTQDAQGVVLETSEHLPNEQAVRSALGAFIGDIMQRPSAFSAIKQGGQPAYKSARRGELPLLDARPVQVFDIAYITQCAPDGHLIRVDCGRGTYIRALCEDIGKAVGCNAHMRFLLRSRAGAFTLDNALTMEEAAQFAQDGTLEAHLIPPDEPFADLPRADAPPEMTAMARNGARLSCARCRVKADEGALYRVYAGGLFCGISSVVGQELVYRVIL